MLVLPVEVVAVEVPVVIARGPPQVVTTAMMMVTMAVMGALVPDWPGKPASLAARGDHLVLLLVQCPQRAGTALPWWCGCGELRLLECILECTARWMVCLLLPLVPRETNLGQVGQGVWVASAHRRLQRGAKTSTNLLTRCKSNFRGSFLQML